jgi:N-acetylglucosamine-6-sulfatase
VDTRYPKNPAYYQTDVLARKAVDMIGRAARGARPFFMWNTFVAPHFSFSGIPEPDDPPISITRTPEPAPRDRNRFAGWPLPITPSFNEHDISDKPDTVRIGHPPIDDTVRAAIQENYQQELESLQAVDRAVGQVVDELERTGQLDRTLIVFTSDNGYFHGEHRIPKDKQRIYEESIRVPLQMRGPGIPAGETVADPVINADLAPTIVDAANATARLTMDGTSLIPVAEDPGLERGRELLIEEPTFEAIRTSRYMYAEHSGGAKELYDLAKDPFELQSRHDTPAYASVKADLASRLDALKTCSGSSCHVIQPGPAAAP